MRNYQNLWTVNPIWYTTLNYLNPDKKSCLIKFEAFNEMVYKMSRYLTENTSVTILEKKLLILFREIMAVYRVNYAKRVNTVT